MQVVQDRRRPKLLSSIGNVSSSVSAGNNHYLPQSQSDHPLESQQTFENERQPFDIQTSKPEVQVAYTAPEVVNRNKRLFSTLIGHLGSAKKKLEADHENIQRQSSLMRSIAEKNTEEFKKLRLRKRKEYEFSVKKKRIEEKVSEIENITKSWKQQMQHITDFILTASEPSIAWIPQHANATTISLINKRREEIEAAIAQREQEDEQKIFELRAELANDESEISSILEGDNHQQSTLTAKDRRRRRTDGDDELNQDDFDEGDSEEDINL